MSHQTHDRIDDGIRAGHTRPTLRGVMRSFSVRRTATLTCVAFAGLGGQALAAGNASTTSTTTTTKSAPKPTNDGSTLASQQIDTLIRSVPQATLDAVGLGTATQKAGFKLRTLTGKPLTVAGKPDILMGSLAWCPHCAVGNIAMAIALSHFGTVRRLSSIDTGTYFKSLPNINGLSFDRSQYFSSTLSFNDVIVQTKTGENFEKPTAAQAQAFKAIKVRSFPAFDIGGVYGMTGIPFNPAVVKGMSTLQIVKSLANENSKVAQAVDGFSNLLTAAICDTTDGLPTEVCLSPGVSLGAQGL